MRAGFVRYERLNRAAAAAMSSIPASSTSLPTPTSGVVGLRGNLAPDGALVTVAGMTPEEQVFTGPARVFESEEEAFECVSRRGYQAGDVIVIRNQGPAGGSGRREMLATTAALSGQAWARRWL